MEEILKNDIEDMEKWLLTQCYLKTLKKNLPETWKVPRWFTWHHRPVTLNKARDLSDTFWEHLFKSEILLNYYGMEVSSKQASHYRHPPGAEYFQGNKVLNHANRSQPHITEDRFTDANQSIRKTIERLRDRGLIAVETAHPNASKITLTDAGQSLMMLS